MKNNWVIILSSLLVLLFLYTGLSKFINFKQFTADLHNQVFPQGSVPFLRWMVPSLEILISAGLLFNRTRLVSLVAALNLMLLFTLYTLLVLLHVFSRVPCSCGGVIRSLGWGQHLVFNLFFVSVSATAIKLCMHTKTGDAENLQQSRR